MICPECNHVAADIRFPRLIQPRDGVVLLSGQGDWISFTISVPANIESTCYIMTS